MSTLNEMNAFMLEELLFLHFLAFLSAGIFGGSTESGKANQLCVLCVSSAAGGEIFSI